MGDLSDIVNAETHAIALQLPPFFEDHHLGGCPVLAAVEAMELLAAHIPGHDSKYDTHLLVDIRFDKFLFLPPSDPRALFAQITPRDDGSRSCMLTSRFRKPGAAISRTLTHTALTMGHDLPPAVDAPMDTAACLAGIVTRVDPDRIYRELVPFGPAYRNLRHLLISPDGALARVGSPNPPDPRADLRLGSPYVLDAAFHAACVWCQRFRDTVAFPVAMRQRRVLRPTRLDEVYTARIVPVRVDQAPFVFDILILDHRGGLREAAYGVEMRDVSGGRRRPPKGFWQPVADDPLSVLRRRVAGLVLVEREAVAEFAELALSDREQNRLRPMTPTRKMGYLSARLALKRLSRCLSASADPRPAHTIDTVARDGRSPQCPPADNPPPFCSVSHDRRFCIAVAAERPVGVDVEPLSDKALGAPDLFMDAAEQAVVDRSVLDRAGAALRVWSAKEAAAKATGLDLADVWQRVRVETITPGNSRLVLDGGGALTAWHATMDSHLFTLLTVEGRP